MQYPAIIWLPPDHILQARHLCFLAKNIEQGLFSKGDYWVLPYLVVRQPKCVYFPDLGFSNQFWKAIKKTTHVDLCGQYPKLAVTEATTKLDAKSDLVGQQSIFQSKWEMIAPQFFNYCQNFLTLEETLGKLAAIEVYQSPFGTAGSYDFRQTPDGLKLLIVLRSDFGIHNLVRVLLMALWTKHERRRAEIQEMWWQHKMAVIDFLMHNTVFGSLAALEGHSDEGSLETYTRNSGSYLKSLGMSPKPELTLKQGNIIMRDGTILDPLLTVQEQAILMYFLEHAQKLVSYDEIGGVLWQDAYSNKFSLYSITKVIENVRRKLHNLGINRELIYTVRKKGYLFTN